MRDLRPRTRAAYVSYPVLLGRHYKMDPATLSEEQVRAYFLFLRNERRYAGSSLFIALAALRCFYSDHLGVGARWKLWQEMRVRRAQTLPVVLTREEVGQLLRAVRCDRFRTVLRLIYGCGLRITEAAIQCKSQPEAATSVALWNSFATTGVQSADWQASCAIGGQEMQNRY